MTQRSDKDLIITNYGQGDGYVWIEVGGLFLYSCYCTPNGSVDEFELFINKIARSVTMHKDSAIIAGDFNAKSASWGEPVGDRKGAIVTEWMAASDLVLANDGKTPTFLRGSSKSIIDLTLCSHKVINELTNWKVSNEENFSLHENIYSTIDTPEETVKIRKNKGWKIIKDNIPKFVETLKEELMSRQPKEATDLTNALKDALDKCFPKKTGTTNINKLYWWSQELQTLKTLGIKAKRALTRANAKKDMEPTHIEVLKRNHTQARKNLNNAIRKAKEVAWNKLCMDVNHDVWGLGYKIVSHKLNLKPRITISDQEQKQLPKACSRDTHRASDQLWTPLL